ncbi:MAG TPA: hypothetical protein VMQ81_04570 [Acidimicrobiia bacterium]|nr:hypothetical protein [Acidimicrobiia bacterium]
MDRRYLRACTIGGVLAALVFTWMLCAGRADLLQSHELTGIYDAQARSLLDGHWDIPRDKLSLEAYIIDGKAYSYYGPVPSVLRMPVLAVTDSLDGRLAQVSMLGAFVVLIVFTSRLSWRVRGLARAGEPVTRFELWVAGAFVFVVGAGSVVLFLASRSIVYHEAELWGAALAVASFHYLVGFIVVPGRGDLVGAAVFGGLAFLTRPSVGAGPLVALAVVLGGRLLVVVARRVGRTGLQRPLAWLGLGDEATNRSYLVPLVAAVAVPLAVYMYVNYARFGHPWEYPITRHITVLEGIDQMRIEALAANGDSLFGAKFVPTNLLATFRPDGLRADGLFPFLTFPPAADILGAVKFDTIDRAASLPATMPLLFLLSVVGATAVFLRRPAAVGSRLIALRVPVLGALAGCFVTLSINFVAHRYLSDYLPVLVLLGLAGVNVLFVMLAAPGRRPAVVRTLTVALAGLAAFSLWANFGLGILYQRAYNVFLSESDRTAFIGFQQDFDETVVPGDSRFDVRSGNELPDAGPAGSVFVVGDCDGLYWSDGDKWFGLERTNATGGYPLRITLPDRPRGTRETLLVAGNPEKMDRIGVEYRDDDVVFTIDSGVFGVTLRSEPVDIEPGQPTRVDIVYDNSPVGRLTIEVDGKSLFSFNNLLAIGPVAVAGSDDPGAPEFDGEVEQLPARTPLCRERVDEVG